MKTQFDYPGNELAWQFLENESVVLLFDAHTHTHCLSVLFNHMPFLAKFKPVIVPAGEAAKQLHVAESIWRELHQMKAHNNTLLIGVGGGALCDLAAFCASVFKRGIRLRLIPTTLLAMVDAALGGKTALDFEGIKNNIGTFYPAEALYIQPEFLKTLAEREYKSGIAEMIKHGLLDSVSTWNTLQTYTVHEFGELDAIQTSQSIKRRLVDLDPLDQNQRQALNFGHSIGHALEASRMQTEHPLLHGEAILWGMQVELYLSIAHCGLPPSVWHTYIQLYKRLFPELHPIGSIDAETFMANLMHDKKNKEGIRMSLISSPGAPQVQVPVSSSSILEAIYENCNK